jgi:hypothetical protein
MISIPVLVLMGVPLVTANVAVVSKAVRSVLASIDATSSASWMGVRGRL